MSWIFMDQYAGILQINLSAIRSNWRLMREHFSGPYCGAVIKSNAYGLGVAPVAQALYSEGCRQFFVATFDEGVQVKRLLPNPVRVYVLQGCKPGCERRFIERGLIPVLYSPQMVERWLSLPGSPVRNCAIKVNSGMNRLGLDRGEFERVLADRRLLEAGVQMLISHLACADDPSSSINADQLARFSAMAQACAEFIPGVQCSLVNSAGVFLPESYHFDVARPGIGLYGCGDSSLRPVVSLFLPVLQVRDLRAGESVGYGATFKAERDMRIAIVCGGYADGVFRALSNVAQGWFNGYLPMLGRVSMDSSVFDVSALPIHQQPREGDLIELLGDHVSVDDLAAQAGTISYELLTRLGQRLEKRYVE
jgi:alanine racemase